MVAAPPVAVPPPAADAMPRARPPFAPPRPTAPVVPPVAARAALDALPVGALYDLARVRGVRGRSLMSRGELLDALTPGRR